MSEDPKVSLDHVEAPVLLVPLALTDPAVLTGWKAQLVIKGHTVPRESLVAKDQLVSLVLGAPKATKVSLALKESKAQKARLVKPADQVSMA